jgi:hypothetical protein
MKEDKTEFVVDGSFHIRSSFKPVLTETDSATPLAGPWPSGLFVRTSPP